MNIRVQTFFEAHFDHLMLAGLAVVGGVGAVWADAHTHVKSAEFLFAQAGACVGALFMRMQAARGAQSTVLATVDPPAPPAV